MRRPPRPSLSTNQMGTSSPGINHTGRRQQTASHRRQSMGAEVCSGCTASGAFVMPKDGLDRGSERVRGHGRARPLLNEVAFGDHRDASANNSTSGPYCRAGVTILLAAAPFAFMKVKIQATGAEMREAGKTKSVYRRAPLSSELRGWNC